MSYNTDEVYRILLPIAILLVPSMGTLLVFFGKNYLKKFEQNIQDKFDHAIKRIEEIEEWRNDHGKWSNAALTEIKERLARIETNLENLLQKRK